MTGAKLKMDFKSKTPRSRRRQLKLEGGRNEATYPHSLQFYSQPPTQNISLQEFEDFAIDRLRGERYLELRVFFYQFST